MDQLSDLSPAVLAAPAGALLFIIILISVMNRLVYLCRPNEILIFSGGAGGSRNILRGWAFKKPFLEEVKRLDRSLISVPMTIQGAYSEGGIPLAVHAIANVKVSSNERLLPNAIERFLGRHQSEIARVAKETLEGHLRGVLATLTPEEVNEDRLKFAAQLTEEAEVDLDKLGLQLDTLKIQHVSDDRDYLESIGRKQVAEILRMAEVAESDAVREAEEAESAARARGEVAKTNALASIQAKTNELRQISAELDAEAKSEEERAQAAAAQARAQAEQELQRIRGELEQLRLAADVTIPAQVSRKVRELLAAGKAARISADGEAQAQSLAAITEAWAEAGGKAMDMYVLQNLEEIFGQVATAARRLDVGEVNLVDGGDGTTLPAYLAAYPAAVGALIGSISDTVGVDIAGVLKGNGTPSNGVAPALSAATAAGKPTNQEGRTV